MSKKKIREWAVTIVCCVIIAAVGLAVVIGGLCAACYLDPRHETYTVNAEYVGSHNNSIFYADENGEVWELENAEPVGENVILVMNDRGTANIFDDKIIEVKPAE